MEVTPPKKHFLWTVTNSSLTLPLREAAVLCRYGMSG